MATGNVSVFEAANIATIKKLNLAGIAEELSSHKSASKVNAHQIGNISGLEDALSNKAYSNHTHNISDVSGLQSALNSKADKGSVTQVITVVTNVNFANQTVSTANINIVDGIIVKIN